MSQRVARALAGPSLVCLGLAVALGSVALDGYATYRNAIAAARESTETHREAGSPPASDVTGYPVACYYTDHDGYYYATYARQMVKEGTFRVRWTYLDNAPEGREVHWSSLFSWWLVALAAVHSLVSGAPLSQAVLTAGYYANPLSLAVLLAALAAAVYRRVGTSASLVLLFAFSTHREVLWDFGYARPDHHGLSLFFAAGMLLCVVLGGAGWVTVAVQRSDFQLPLSQARRWFIAAGVLGGCGLWIGATPQSVVIFGLWLGAALTVGTLVPRRRSDAAGTGDAPSAVYEPVLWRWWACSGALTSLLAYLVEYFPHHVLAMRLEVNHPLYALSWVCSAEVVYRLADWRAKRLQFRRMRLLQLTLLAAGALSLFALVLFGPVRWYRVRDPYMLRFHEQLDEFQPFFEVAASLPTVELIAAAGVLAVSILAVAPVLLAARSSRPDKTLVVLSLVPTLVLAGWTLYQWRWIALATVAACCLLITLFVLRKRTSSPLTTIALAATVAVVALQALMHVQTSRRTIAGARRRATEGQVSPEVHMRDLAMQLARQPQPTPANVMSSPEVNARLCFFGPFHVSGTPYWENVEGLRATADFFADYGDAEALRIAREREVDWVVVPKDLRFCMDMHFIKHGNDFPMYVQQTLAFRLVEEANFPDWLQPVKLERIGGGRLFRIYRVRRAATSAALPPSRRGRLLRHAPARLPLQRQRHLGPRRRDRPPAKGLDLHVTAPSSSSSSPKQEPSPTDNPPKPGSPQGRVIRRPCTSLRAAIVREQVRRRPTTNPQSLRTDFARPPSTSVTTRPYPIILADSAR